MPQQRVEGRPAACGVGFSLATPELERIDCGERVATATGTGSRITGTGTHAQVKHSRSRSQEATSKGCAWT